MIVKKKLAPELSWFPKLKFGMFVHFGVYALLGRGEWVMYHEGIPRDEYEKLRPKFNPAKFDADEWVAVAKRAGARYITCTAKHHDGFCLWDSDLTDYKITNTPFGRDLIGELIAACHRANMRICLFYSQPDWHHPCFVNREGAWKELQFTRPDDTPDWAAYVRYYHGQVEELCTKYGRIDGIWFDGSHRSEQDWQGRKVYKLIKKHQPHAVVNDRANHGDYFTPERRLSLDVGADGYMTEVIQAVDAGSWGWKKGSPLYTLPPLVRSLVKQASIGGNFLLNVGPKPDGTIPVNQARRLAEVGDWLKTHGKAVFGTVGCGRNRESDDRVYTRNGKRLYLHLIDWPDKEELALTRLKVAPKGARLLGGKRLRVASCGEGIVLRGFPALPVDTCCSVVELTFDTEEMLKPEPKPAPAPIHAVTKGAPLRLRLRDGKAVGYAVKGARMEIAERDRQKDELALWKSVEQRMVWRVRASRGVRCRVSVGLACKALYAGSTFAVKAAGQTLEGVVPPSRHFGDFKTVDLGVLKLPKGTTTITMRPTHVPYSYIFANVDRVSLEPAD